MSDQDSHPQVPPASFDFLVASLQFQAQVAMGAISLGDDSKDQVDLDAARHFIDLLAMLEEKTKGNLTLEEGLHLNNGLTELRFRFVQAAGDAAKSRIVSA